MVRPPFGYIQLAHVGLRGHRLNGFSGAAVLERIRHVKVLYSQHVLQRLHGGIQGLSHLHRWGNIEREEDDKLSILSLGHIFLFVRVKAIFFQALMDPK